MAVEIPVYVDIQGAFNRAVSEIPKEIPKLESVLSRHALKMNISVGGENMSIQRMLTDTTLSANDLEKALRAVRKEFDAAVQKSAGKKNTTATVNNLAKAYGLLQQRIKGFYDANSVAAMRVEDSLAKVLFKIQDLRSKLSTLTPGTDQFSKLNYELKLQQERLTALNKQQALFKAGVDSSNSSLLKQSSLVRQLSGYFSGLYAVHTAIRFVKQIRDVTGELEYQRVALGHLLQDVDYGNELFNKVVEAAKQSPFRITQLVTYTKQLAAYRIEQENLYDTTMRLADISAGLGVDMNRLILAFGQVRAASVLRGQELRQFTEAGIPLVEELAKKFRELGREGTTTADVFKLISERAVPFEMVKEIFEDMTNAGGMFYKMQEEQAKTLKGRWEKLKDAYDQALNSLGSNETFQNWNDKVLSILNAIAGNLTGIVRIVNAGIVGWVAYKIATSNAAKATIAVAGANLKATVSMIKMFGVMGTLKAGMVALRQAWNRFTAAITKNWVGLAITAFATLLTYFTTFRKKTQDATDEVDAMKEAIEKMRKANKDYQYGKDLIKNYEELAKKTNLTANESERLHKTLDELKTVYPELKAKMDGQNLSLEKQIELLKEAAEASHASAVQEAQNRLNTQRDIIRGLQEEAEAAELEKEAAQRRHEAAQEAEKTGRTLIGLQGQEIVVSAKELKERTIEAAAAARQAEDAYDDIMKRLREAQKYAEELEKLINPQSGSKELSQWQIQLTEIQNKMTGIGDTPLFTGEDIKGFTSVYDMSKKLKKAMDDLTVSIAGMKALYDAMEDKETDAAKSLKNDIDRQQKQLDIAQKIKETFALVFKKDNSQTSYTQDPFIKQMQDRIKFMKDFQKGYEDLSKYMSESNALGKETETMLSRGLSLGITAEEQKRAATDLSQWYKDTIESTYAYLQKNKGVTGSVEDFLSRQITGSGNRDKMLRDFQSLLQSLWDAKTDFDISQEKKNWEASLKKLSEEIKRSEMARNFYEDILDITGDEQLATTLGVQIYGDIGDDFKKRIETELKRAMDDVDAEKMTDELRKALETQDFSVITANLDKFPEEWRKRLQEMASDSQKFNAERAKDLLKALDRAKTYGEKQVELARQTARRTAQIQSLNVSDDVKNQMLEQNTRKQAEEAAKTAYEAFRDMPMYVELFDDLDNASSRMLKNMRQNLEDMRDNWKSLTPRELKELQSRINELDEQIARNNPFKALITSIREYRNLQKEHTQAEVENEAIQANERLSSEKELLATYQKEYDEAAKKRTQDEAGFKAAEDKLKTQAKVVDKAEEEANAAQKTAQEYKEAKKHIRDAADKLSDWAGYITDSLDGVGEIVATFASDDTAETFNIIAEGIGKTVGGAAQLGKGIAELIALNPQGIVDTIQGLGSMISGIFGTKSQLSIKKINKQIEDQGRLLGQLEYSYGRLDKAIEKAFGSDYIYNYSEQLKNLAAQQAAYEEQARLEREKGKKKDKDKIAEYEQSARDTADAIEEMEGQLSEYFSGSELTSAAEDFANSWIEAYQEFGSTTDAMKEKFQDMINNMITKSLAGKIMQQMLQPIFNEIDRLAQDGDLTASEIGRISEMATAAIPQIDNAMTTLMNNLIASGIDLRTHAGQFTGISRDIAGASEESILGLAAGVNTANFYMSHLPAIAENVAALRVALAGETPETVRTTPSEGPTYEDQMLGYVSTLPQMRDDMYYVRTLLDRVIKPKGQGGYAVVIQ